MFKSRSDLVPDCEACAALCCVVPSFETSEDFGLDKAAGAPCPNLTKDFRCRIHGELIERGFRGCAIYDCYGAGQNATRSFPDGADVEAERGEAFLILRVLHELVWQLTEAIKLCQEEDDGLIADLEVAAERIDSMILGPPSLLLATDPEPLRISTRRLLRRVGESLGTTRLSVLD